MSEENKPQEKLELRLNDFDPDLSPRHQTNQEAAAQRGLAYDPHKKSFVDEDGCLIRDRFGQPY